VVLGETHVVVFVNELKRIERLIYAFINGSRNLYGPKRIARRHLKAPKAMGGINGVDLEIFINSIVIRQWVQDDVVCWVVHAAVAC
jgi:hypothetical protein